MYGPALKLTLCVMVFRSIKVVGKQLVFKLKKKGHFYEPSSRNSPDAWNSFIMGTRHNSWAVKDGGHTKGSVPS